MLSSAGGLEIPRLSYRFCQLETELDPAGRPDHIVISCEAAKGCWFQPAGYFLNHL